MNDSFRSFDEQGYPIDVEVPDGVVLRVADAGSFDSASVACSSNLRGDFMFGSSREFTRYDALDEIKGADFARRVTDAIADGLDPEQVVYPKVREADIRLETGGLIEATLRGLFADSDER
jgi:hypothetical protein